MILIKTPLRITLGGGGTDDPEFVREHGGFALTAAINKYVFIGVHEMLDKGYRLKYSQEEHVQTVDEIEHPFFREAIRFFNIPPNVEIVSLADIHAGSGLGSSGAFTVGLCQALVAFNGRTVMRPNEIAKIAAHLELDVLKRGGGVQDHYASALGGLQRLVFKKDHSVEHEAIAMNPKSLQKLQYGLSLFLVGYSRDADDVLVTQTQDGLVKIKEQGQHSWCDLLDGDLDAWAYRMNTHWQLKKQRHDRISSSRIDDMYDWGLKHGALGGKLVGAGSGGFLMFYSNNPEHLSKSFKGKLQEISFEFSQTGTETICSA